MKYLPVFLVLLLGACVSGDDPPPTGIQGQVLAGPQCAVEQAGSPCPDSPLAVTLGIRKAGNQTGSPIVTGDDGRFRTEVEPGDYEVVPLPVGDSPIPLPPGPIAVTVEEGEMAEVTITYDTGIR